MPYPKLSQFFRISLPCTLVLALLLEWWRPFYFLTDDTLSGYLPVAVEFCRSLWEGKNPFINDYLFGGHYPLLQDPGGLQLLNPFLWLCSPLALTRYYLWLPELLNIIYLIIGVQAFGELALFLNQRYQLQLRTELIVVAALSYMFSPFALSLGSSWIGFLGNMAALPIIALGVLKPDGGKRILLGWLFQITCGHLHPLIFSTIFLTLWSLSVCHQERSWQPLRRYATSSLGSLLIMAPLLWASWSGFSTSSRHLQYVPQTDLSRNYPFGLLIFSNLLGPSSALFSSHYYLFLLKLPYVASLGWSVAHYTHLFAIIRPLRRDRLWWGLAGLTGLAVVLSTRGPFLSGLMSQLPLFKSLRWSFRELLFFLFFVHVWGLWGYARITANLYRPLLFIGILIAALFFVPAGPPSLNPLNSDRTFLLNGQAEAFWHDRRAEWKPGTLLIPVANPVEIPGFEQPASYILWGAYNYPSLFRIPSATGYSPTSVRNGLPPGYHPYRWMGLINKKQSAQILREYPQYVIITVENISPITFQWQQKGQPDRTFIFSAPATARD
jgi:hypothetical protein